MAGALVFIRACYEDLLEQAQAAGKSSVDLADIEKEVRQIGEALEGVHITPEGRLVERR